MKNIPVKIYLQVGELEELGSLEELGELGESHGCAHQGGGPDFNEIARDGSVTWCSDKIGGCDVAYLRESAVMPVFQWLLGYMDFPKREAGEGAFWWRKHLRRELIKAGIKFVSPEEEVMDEADF